jgi:hypothetical protein
MRQVVPVRVHELVDPLDAHRLAPARLDRERGVVEALRVVSRAIAPNRGRLQPHALRQDVLPELPNGDFVVVDALHGRRRGAARHRRRDHQRGHVLRDGPGRERPVGHLRERLPGAHAERKKQDRAARSAVPEKLSTRDPNHLGLLVATAEAPHLEAGAAWVPSAASRPARRPTLAGGSPASTRSLPWALGSFEHRGADAAPGRRIGAVPLYGAASAPSPRIGFDHSPQQHVNAVSLMRHVCHAEKRR